MFSQSISFLLQTVCLALCGDSTTEKTHVQIITAHDYTYEIEVGGYRDPVNETIIIENLGAEPVVNPRITVNGALDWCDVESIAAEATRGCSTEKEKAHAIWAFVMNNSQQIASPGDFEAMNPVIYFNVYGYGNCAYHAQNCVALARALGMRARHWTVWHHSVSEFRYEENWHMLDSSIGIYYLMEDNLRIASIEQLWQDQMPTGGLFANYHLTGFSMRGRAVRTVFTDMEGGNEFVWQDGKSPQFLHYFEGDQGCYLQPCWDGFSEEPHTMAMTLRPGERLIRNWKGGSVYYNYRWHEAEYEIDHRPWRKPICYGDGKLTWRLDPAGQQAGGLKTPAQDKLEIYSPYTVIGAEVVARVPAGQVSSWDDVDVKVFLDSTGSCRETSFEVMKDKSAGVELRADLDEILYPAGNQGRHAYALLLEQKDRIDPRLLSGENLISLEVITDIQCAPFSLPGLSLGKNLIRYRDKSRGIHKVRITHCWRERYDNHPPSAPARALYPADRSITADQAPLFRWTAASDMDGTGQVADYQILLSFDPRCRWPVSTSLHTETGSPAAEWQLPPGWLSPGAVYYWKVRARDRKGAPGEWSPVFSFETCLECGCDIDKDGRVLITDVIKFLILLRSGASGRCMDRDGDGLADIKDAIFLLREIIDHKCPEDDGPWYFASR